MPSRSCDTTISTETVRKLQNEAMKVLIDCYIQKHNRCRTVHVFILQVFFCFLPGCIWGVHNVLIFGCMRGVHFRTVQVIISKKSMCCSNQFLAATLALLRR